MDPDYDVMEGIIPDALHCPSLMKSKAKDPDLPMLHEALAGPYGDEFLEAIRNKIKELEDHGTWEVASQSSLPEGANILPSTWTLHIKTLPNERVHKFKTRFCTQRDHHQGIDYVKKFVPIVSWSIISHLSKLYSRLTHSPKASHTKTITRIAKYPDYYDGADFAGLWKHEDDQDPEYVKSRTGFVFTLAGCSVSWSSKLQTKVATSTLAAEYIALSLVMQEFFPMQRILKEISEVLHLTIFEDNNGALALATAPKLTPRTKHIAVKYHFFKEHIGEEKGIQICEN